jgi:hydroxymethylpyrimidine pyrophosphatase-like HAD family hydrolase
MRRDAICRCSHNRRYPTSTLEIEVVGYIENLLKSQEPLEYSTIIDVDVIKASQIKKIREDLEKAKAAYYAGVYDLTTFAEEKKRLENNMLTIKSTSPEKKDDGRKQLKNMLEELNLEECPNKKRLIISKRIESFYLWPDGKLSVKLL